MNGLQEKKRKDIHGSAPKIVIGSFIIMLKLKLRINIKFSKQSEDSY